MPGLSTAFGAELEELGSRYVEWAWLASTPENSKTMALPRVQNKMHAWFF